MDLTENRWQRRRHRSPTVRGRPSIDQVGEICAESRKLETAASKSSTHGASLNELSQYSIRRASWTYLCDSNGTTHHQHTEPPPQNDCTVNIKCSILRLVRNKLGTISQWWYAENDQLSICAIIRQSSQTQQKFAFRIHICTFSRKYDNTPMTVTTRARR